MTKKKNLVLTTAMAAGLLATYACSSDDDWSGEPTAERETAVCVNGDGERVDDDLCDNDGHRGGSGVSSAFLWYYLGRNSAIPYYGDSIHRSRYQGSYRPAPGTGYVRAPAHTGMTRSQAVSRGGLGSSGRSFGARGS